MRTTLTIDDDLGIALRERSQRTGRPFKDVVNEALRVGLKALADPGERQPIRIKTFSAQARPGVDLTQALRLAADLEDWTIGASVRAGGDGP